MSADLLLDTHTLLWWLHQPSSLSMRAVAALADGANRVFVSPVSAMEIAAKSRKGRLEFDSPLIDDFPGETAKEGFAELPITADHAQRAGRFDGPHNDPWDRLLAAQAQAERLTLVTCDARMAAFAVTTLW